jgi:small conductance mechanosensitive channel
MTMISIPDIRALLIAALIRIVVAFVIVLLGIWVARLCRRGANKVFQRTTLTPSLIILIDFFIYYGIIILIGFLALAVLGVPTTSLVASTSAILVVLGIAMRQTIGDFAATVVFMLFQPFKVGDTIETYGKVGVVKEIQFFNTVLQTSDNKEVSLPNSKVQESGIANYSRNGTLRADLVINVSYEEDPSKVKRILEEVLNSDERVLTEPAPEVFVQDLSAGSVTWAARPFVNFTDYGKVQVDLRERLKQRFQEEGISLPRSQHDVHLFHEAAA